MCAHIFFTFSLVLVGFIIFRHNEKGYKYTMYKRCISNSVCSQQFRLYQFLKRLKLLIAFTNCIQPSQSNPNQLEPKLGQGSNCNLTFQLGVVV